jgi:creatinine amidohydrolase/Fe(II)-dependent formamide hydrolase-like protein
MGKPRYASPEKGEHLLNAYANGVSDFLLKVADWDGHSWLPQQSE